ncbi:MAG TPA: N-acetylmuramoyl-L-alanine amidase family protein [Clostridia bacterium]|nr:N-acetylmuramoyl-L-alanine amidase family protein [Clostridia bacterium]
MKKTIAVILVLCLMTTSFAGTVFAQTTNTKTPPLSMQILGKKVSTASPPIVKNNRIYLPVRAVGEALSYKAVWTAKTKTMELKASSQTIKVTIGNVYAYVNGKKTKLDAAPIMYNDRAYIPLTFVQKYFNFTTTYDKAKNLITINKKTAAASTGSSAAAAKGVYVLGKKMTATDLAITKNNKVYIPLRHIGEGLGYKVTWNAASKTMELKSANGSAKVVIGSGNGYVNGKSAKIDPAPLLYNGRAYVPITFIQNNFDYDVSYDKAKNIVKVDKKAAPPPIIAAEKPIEYKTATIDDIIYDDNGGFPQLNIAANNPIKYKSYTMSNPDRMVVDIESSLLNTEFETKEIGKGGVIRVRVAQFSKSPDVVRVVIDLEDQTRCKLVQSNDKKTVSLIYANIINPVSFIKEEGKDVIMIRGSQDMDPNVFKLENPDRLVVDMYKSVLSEYQSLDTKTSYVKSIRSGQADVGVARVVLDLEPGMYYDYETEGSLTKVYISNIPFSFFDYKKYYSSAFIELSPGVEVEYQPIIDNVNRTLKIMIPKDLDVEQKTYEMNDNVMEYVTVTKETHGENIYTVASFMMKPTVDYELLSPAITKLVSIKFKQKAERVDQLTVLIDPGHGGKDPGARAKDGTNEKDLNLDVALRLNRILKDIGFNTMITRKDDRYVDLASRSGMANNNYVDFFMSIHFNAFTSTAKGIETLYYPNEITDEYPFDNKKMANIFHNEITDALKRPSRGITPRPGLHVLNKTKMPAILAELGFITNPEEFAQIKKAEYREMAARALAVSIVRHFEEIEGISLDIDIDAIYAAPTPANPYSLQSAALNNGQSSAEESLITEQITAQDNMSGN